MTLSLSGERISLAGAPEKAPATYAFPSPGLALLDDDVDDGSYLVRVKGDPEKLLADSIVETIEEHYDVTALIEGEPA